MVAQDDESTLWQSKAKAGFLLNHILLKADFSKEEVVVTE
jgi:hypothetical protein